MAKAPPPLEVGDIMPRFTLSGPDGAQFDNHADEHAGKPHVFAFARTPADEPVAALLQAQDAIETTGGVAAAIARQTAPGVLADGDGRLSAFAVGGAGVVVVGRNGHVLSLEKTTSAEAIARAVALTRGLQAEAEPRPGARQAPILMVPNVLSPQDCQRLITVYNMDGNVFVEPGHGLQNRKTDYKMRIPEYGRKDRIDHWVVNPQTMGFINERLQRRLFPEIQKAFHYKITRHERYRIGCYEGERGGELHGHRDNTQANVAHRRFACSINLNAEDFEGGELAFPEFGGQRFSPATGEAIVFSSSLLHEPLHVTKGRRLVLLAFLFGET